MEGSVQLATPTRSVAPLRRRIGPMFRRGTFSARASALPVPGSCRASITAEQYAPAVCTKMRPRMELAMATYTFSLSTSEVARQAGIITSASFDEALRLVGERMTVAQGDT